MNLSVEIPIIPSDTELPTDPRERKRLKDKIYHKRYAEKKRRLKEEQKARQIIIEFGRLKESSTAEELNKWIFAIGQTAADTLLNIVGQSVFDEFTGRFRGCSRLDLIFAMIEELNKYTTLYPEQVD
jgi:hypothetical protein